MPQKPLLKPGKKIEKKKPAANKHGKGSNTRKGEAAKGNPMREAGRWVLSGPLAGQSKLPY
jgi:hypothetical protein